VTIKPYCTAGTPENVLITLTGTGTTGGIDVGSKSNVTIQGLRFVSNPNTHTYLIKIQATQNFNFSHNEAFGGTEDWARINGSGGTPSRDITIHRNLIKGGWTSNAGSIFNNGEFGGGAERLHISYNDVRSDYWGDNRAGEDIVTVGGCTNCSATYNYFHDIMNVEGLVDIKQNLHTSPFLFKGNTFIGPFKGTKGGQDALGTNIGHCAVVGDAVGYTGAVHIIEDNEFFGSCTYAANIGSFAPFAIGGGTRTGNAIIRRNLVVESVASIATPTGRIWRTTNTQVYHNTFIKSGIRINNTPTCPTPAITISNNIFYQSRISDTTDACPTEAYTAANNIEYQIVGGFERGTHTGTITTDPLINTSNGTLTSASSPAVNAATDSGGCNGVCDIGAFELFTLPVGGGVAGVAGNNKIVLTFTNNLRAPLVASNFLTGWTATQDAVNKPLTSAALQGSNQIVLTTTTDMTAGTALKVSYSSATGNLTDSSPQTVKQQFLSITDYVVTNSVSGGGPGTVDDTTAHRQSSASATWTFNHITGASADGLVVLCYADTTSQSGGVVAAPTVTFNGDALATAIYHQHTVRRSTVGIWYLKTPDIGTFAVSIVWPLSLQGGCWARSYGNTDATMITNAANQQTSTVAALSMNLSCPIGSEAIGILGTGTGGDAITATTAQDEIINQVDGKTYVGASTPGIGATTIGVSWTGGLVGSNMAVACVRAAGSPSPTHSLDQVAFQFWRELTVIADDTNAPPDTEILWFVQLNCTLGDCPALGLQPRVSFNGGTYTVISTDYAALKIKLGSSPNYQPANTAIASCLTAGGLTEVPGLYRYVNDSVAADLAADNCITFAYGLKIAPDATPNFDTWALRLYDESGDPLINYPSTGMIVAIPPPGVAASGRTSATGRSGASGRATATERVGVLE